VVSGAAPFSDARSVSDDVWGMVRLIPRRSLRFLVYLVLDMLRLQYHGSRNEV
jgi:hypothetical protein